MPEKPLHLYLTTMRVFYDIGLVRVIVLLRKAKKINTM